MQGKTVAQYRIDDELGRGGMGVIYTAHDTSLGRTVALKFLSARLTADEAAKERFIREAQAAAAIQHPNICIIHEIGETPDGQTFIVMPFYQGETLDRVIARGPVDVDQAVSIVGQCAAGLAAAHAAGIVHRDIKPANIMWTEHGHAIILDFGLAKLATVGDLTQEGQTLGTLAYMSPEQMRGENLDDRTDTWSLGSVFFELLASRRPFDGDYEAALVYSVTNGEPRRIGEYREDVPPAVEGLFEELLRKDAADRMDSATLKDHLAGLVRGDSLAASGPAPARAASRAATTEAPADAPAPDHLSLVVVPFNNIAAAETDDYFTDGLTDEIITDLSLVDSLRVISTNSAMMLKGTDKSAVDLGIELGVRYVLHGTVRRAGEKLRITAKLVETATDIQIWAGKYSGTTDDVFEIQETVSRSITEALRVKLTPSANRAFAAHPIDNLEAYEKYLRARREAWKWTEDALELALKYLDEATSIVPQNPVLIAEQGYVYWQYVNAGYAGPDLLDRAEAYTHRVLQLAPDAPYGHRLLGLIAFSKSNMKECVRNLKRTLEVDPNDVHALTWLSIAYGYVGRPEVARPLAERLIEIDPLNPVNHGLPGWLSFVEGRFDEAVGHYREMYNLDSENPAHRWFMAKGLAYAGHLDEAYAIIGTLEAEMPGNLITWMCSFFRLALQGEREGALAVADSDLAAVARTDLSHSWFVGVSYAIMGMKDEALDWLTNAVRQGFVNHPFLATHDRFLEGLRGDERFAALMDEVLTGWQRFVAADSQA